MPFNFYLMPFPPEFQNKAIILGVTIDDRPMDFVLNKIEQFLCSNAQHSIFTPNPEICLRAEKDEDYRYTLNTASIKIPDGFGLKLGAKILGQKLENRVAGSDLTKKLLHKYSNAKTELKLFIVLRTDSLSKEKDIKQIFSADYPNIKFKLGNIDIKKPDDCDKLLNDINLFEPQMLFVCLGAPTQENWIYKYLKLMPSVRVALGLGGSIDFLTNKIKRAPKIMRDLGVEWFYRLYQEPSRLKRIKNATADFLLACHKWKKRITNEYRLNVVAVIKNRQGKFLVQKNPRFKDHWQFPQGGLNIGEDPDAAVVREASEEIGAPEHFLKVIKKIPESHNYDWPEYGKLIKGYKGQQQTAYLLEYSGNETDIDLSASHEAEEIRWLDKQDLLKTIHRHRHEFAKKIIKHL